MGRWLPREEREKRDKKAIELYRSGISSTNIRLRLGIDIFMILRRDGIKRRPLCL